MGGGVQSIGLSYLARRLYFGTAVSDRLGLLAALSQQMRYRAPFGSRWLRGIQSGL